MASRNYQSSPFEVIVVIKAKGSIINRVACLDSVSFQNTFQLHVASQGVSSIVYTTGIKSFTGLGFLDKTLCVGRKRFSLYSYALREFSPFRAP